VWNLWDTLYRAWSTADLSAESRRPPTLPHMRSIEAN